MKSITVALVVVGVATPAFAQNKREMQMMADIRMLQEQNQQLQVELQAAIAALSDALKGIHGRVDEQTNATRKAFADQLLKIDQVGSELRVVREGVSENNVRVAQLSQELEAVRQSIPQFPAPSALPTDPAGDPAAAAAGGGTPLTPTPGAAAPPVPLGPGMSPQKLFDIAQADYYGAQWDLCVSGFDTYIRQFPKSPLASEAQFYIGECQYQDKKFQDAVASYTQVIAVYPKSDYAGSAYYKRGLAFEGLGQVDRARESYEAAVKNFPDSAAARLAKQALDRLKSGRPPK